MKEKHKIMFMKMAYTLSECSTAERAKVGALIVKHDRVLSIGYNGTFPGDDNECEYKIRENFNLIDHIHEDVLGQYQLRTKPLVLHGEFNAISKLARDGQSADNASLFVTLSPCVECAKLIINVGIKNVFFSETYRDNSGIELLRKYNVEVDCVSLTK